MSCENREANLECLPAAVGWRSVQACLSSGGEKSIEQMMQPHPPQKTWTCNETQSSNLDLDAHIVIWQPICKFCLQLANGMLRWRVHLLAVSDPLLRGCTLIIHSRRQPAIKQPLPQLRM